MPCYDGRNDKDIRVEYINGVNPAPLEHQIIVKTDRIKWLEAGLCAIISELERKGIANEIISQASKSGLIDLMGFWVEHSKEDEARIAQKLHEFSEHEQVIIRKLINND